MEAIDKKRARLDKKNLLRRKHTQEGRAAIFINEYIKEKHRETYEEAVTFYNYVNELYPQKGDLRKTEEFKAMRNGMMFVAKRPNIVKQTYTSIPTTGEHEITIVATHEQSETIHLAIQPPIQQAETLPSIEQPETLPSTEQAETLPKTMQLRIPLMSPQEISTTVLEENLLSTLSGELQPTLDEEIPEEIYNKILAELRQDPDLSKLMDEMEQDINENIEEFGEDIDLPIEEDRLEAELSNWEMW